ncbi:Secreted beta-glucosidase SUN41 [Trichinella pseudospiralis]
MRPRKQKQEKLRQVEHIMDKLKPFYGCHLLLIVMEYYVYEYFGIELLKMIPRPPNPLGVVVTNRIIGPAGSTVQAIQQFSGSRLQLRSDTSCDLHIKIIVQDFENIAHWRIQRAKDAIAYVLENKDNQVSLNQKAEQTVRNRCREIIATSNRCRLRTAHRGDNAWIEENDEYGQETISNYLARPAYETRNYIHEHH